MKAKYRIDDPAQYVNANNVNSETDANRALFQMRAAYTAAESADQIKRAALISEILGASFLRHAKY